MPPEAINGATMEICVYKEDVDAIDCLYVDDPAKLARPCAYVLRLSDCDGEWKVYAQECLDLTELRRQEYRPEEQGI